MGYSLWSQLGQLEWSVVAWLLNLIIKKSFSVPTLKY